jgi:deazaflavin-dependent oxidoreductase (nitroreductase family)
VWYFTPSLRTLTWITKVHRGLYRTTRGMLGSSLLQLEETHHGVRLRWLRVLLLTSKGRKTAAPRTVPLPYFVYEGRTFIIASLAGRERHPAWYLNLRERPEVDVQVGSRRYRCRAVTLSGEERERIWTMIVADWARYRIYQDSTRREIPVVELVPT